MKPTRRRVEPEVSALFLLTPIVKTKSNCDEIMARGQIRTKERTSTVTNLLYPALLLVMRCEMCLHSCLQENHATKVTKIPKTKRQKYGMNETQLAKICGSKKVFLKYNNLYPKNFIF
jgi:hypothetical protein